MRKPTRAATSSFIKMFNKRGRCIAISNIFYNLVPEFNLLNSVNDIQTIQNKISDTSGEIVMYQPDETIRLEVRLGEDTVWLSQQQMAELFGTQRQAITKHLQNIYLSEELNRESTCSILELVRQEGKRYHRAS